MTGIEKRFVNSPGHVRGVADDAQAMLDRVEVVPGWRYLDVGCGIGSAARAIAESRELDVTGVDVDPAQIAKANAGPLRANLHFATMDATRLQLADGEFHIVASRMATHHIRRWELALSEMIRVLRPGGYLIYTDFMFPAWLSRAGEWLMPFMGFPSRKRLESLASRTGLAKAYQSRSGLQLRTIFRKPD
jgi:ubiquinone/menaquinone biosynthesis C-methylase UbiE